MPDRQAVLEWVTTEVSADIRRELPHRRNFCILATRTGLEVCRYFGVEVKPLVVRAVAFNKRWGDFAEASPAAIAALTSDEWALASDSELEDLDDAEAWREAIESGAHVVAIRERDPLEGYAGHVVLYAPGDDPYLLDLSCGQFTRSEYDMDFPDALMMRVPAAFAEGEVAAYTTPLDAQVVYRARNDPSFRTAPDWRLKNPSTGKIIRKAKEELHG